MNRTFLWLLIASYAFLPTTIAQCQMSGVTTWLLPVVVDVVDTQREEFFRADTTNIISISSAVHSGDPLNRGNYFEAWHGDSQFVLSPSDLFADFEEYEYTDQFNIQVSFVCTGGNNNLVFSIRVQDTNNNPPRFVPTDTFTFNIAPPIVPGYELTGCYGDLTVRDIDLTTRSIIFGIEENPYFEISYGGVDPTDSKNFNAVLTASTVIRSLEEPLVLQISATDVDDTGDPPHTTYTTITIEATDQFELPAEPVFTEAFYTASYSAGSEQLALDQTIALRQGYDAEVVFSLAEDYEAYFELRSDGNSISLFVIEELPENILIESHLPIVVRATRQYTSGATATVIVELPGSALRFSEISYEGAIVDNVLQLAPLTLEEIGSGLVTATVVGDYQNYFTAQVIGSTVTISYSGLPEAVVQENSFINLLVEASTVGGAASAVVTLEIVKEDSVTPVFEQHFYSGTYDSAGLQLADLVLTQGYDDTVLFSTEGEDAQYFDVVAEGGTARLVVTTPPPADVIASRHQLLFSVHATKPRTVGASAAVSVALPAGSSLRFSQFSYAGAIVDNILQLAPLTLEEIGSELVTAVIVGDYQNYFSAQVIGSTVTISYSGLPEAVVQENSFINLLVEASTVGGATSAVVTLEIVKEDSVTPVFEQNLYSGTYDSAGLQLVDLILTQGYDDTVLFSMEGEDAQYFDVVAEGGTARLVVTTPPPAYVIASRHQLLFSVHATKPRTVGAFAAVAVTLPAARTLRFEEISYTGTLEGNDLEITSFSLAEGYDGDIHFILSGEFETNFAITDENNVISLTLTYPLTAEDTEANNFIVLVLEATGANAVPSTTAIVLYIIKEDTITPVFGERIYSGVITESQEVELNTLIALSQGYDGTDEITLEGEHSEHFRLVGDGNSQNLELIAPLTQEVIEQNHQLTFSVIASRAGTVGAHATISLTLPRDREMEFEQDFYTGSLDNGNLLLNTILLSQGYRDDVVFDLTGDHSESFVISADSNGIVTIELLEALPGAVVDNNSFLSFVLHASGPFARSARTSVTLELIKEPITPLAFSQYVYSGIYDGGQLTLADDIYLREGYDDTVIFTLEGEHSIYFTAQPSGNAVIVVGDSPLPTDVLNNARLLITVVATKQGSLVANAALSIENLDVPILRFAETSYVGTLDGDNLQLEEIILTDGYTPQTAFDINGLFSEHFTQSNIDGVVTISLTSALPEGTTNEITLIVLELVASNINATSTHTVIVIQVGRDDIIEQPMFGETLYTGSYTETEGLASDVIMSLTQGFDDTVTFSLAGAQSQWFTVEQTGNMATLVVTQPIDSAVIANNHYIMFTINAVKPGTMGASSAVSISLPDDFASATVLRFEQASYTGTLLENDLQLSEIILVEGYQDNVVFNLLGEFQEHFLHSNVGNVVRIAIQNMLPTDFTEPFTTLELVASGPESISTHATIVLQVGRDDIIEQPIFGETFYTGSYTETEGLASNVIMSLTQGFDDTVTFSLAGAQSQWFTVEQTGNMATLVVTQPIDSAVIANNHYIMFTINAVKPGTMGASSAVSISLPDDFASATVLRFEQASYTGTLLENDLQLSEIILVEGYQDNVVFDLLGEFQEHFVHSNVGNVVRIAIQNMLPTDFTEPFTTLELVASGPESISTHATIVLQVGRDDIIEQPIFGETFYTGSYTETEGLASDVIMSLTQGFDDTVTFSLAGAQSQWFTVEQTGNMATLVVTQPIDSAVIANNHYIMFTINAVKPGTMGASSAVSISLPDDFSSATVLRFEQASYTGTLLESDLQLSEIILVEGYQDNVVFNLLGEFQEHFVHSNVGNVVRIAIQNMLPTDFTEPFTTLELVASGPESISTHATIVLQVGRDDIIEQPIFGETFYTGSYTETEGLASDVIMSLTQGFDETVTFSLAGAQSQWFTIEQTGNMATLVVTQPIDSAVIANNHYIMFTINAVKPGTMGASSAVSISLPDDFSSATVLRFEQASYTGTLLESDLQLSEIILVEGYQDNVVFNLLGEFQEHFVHSNVGNVVRIAIQNMLPTDFTEPFTTLELVASGPESISTHATIVLQVGRDDIIEQPIFGETFYTGSYTETEGLASDVIMSLTQGFDDTVTFSLAGAQSQWFTVEQTGNMATLVVTQPIDSAVIANNHYIMFTINAVKPGTMGARSAVSISLPDDFSSATVLRFEQASYTGTLLESDLQLSEIILVEGYQDNVVFNLLGEFQEHFVHSNVGNVVRISIQNMLPTDFTEPFTTLELVASGPESISTHATIVLQVGRDDIIEQPIFGETFYTGSYTETEGLASDVIMSLTQGFDDTVTFSLAGAQSQWFTVEQTGNMATLVVTQPIDSAVIANNHYIMFTINAVKPGTMGASSTVSISLPDDLSSATVLRFEQASYTGTLLENDLQLSEIILVEGYQDNVVFDLLGEFQEHFVHSNVGNVVRIAIQNMLPTDFTELFTTLELVASGPESISTHATIVLQVGRDDIIEQPIFGETFYTGSYTETEGLVSDVIMSLTQGFDDTVTFSLAGAQSQWFTVEQTGNMATLVVTQPIDSAVIANNHYIMFTINAVKPGTMGASSAVSISLPDDFSSATVLRFEQASYTGTLLESDLQLSEIILVEGYQDNVVFNLLGEFQEHFVHSNVGNVVRIAIQNMLPTDFTEPFTTLELVASGPESISTHATIVLQVGRDDIIEQPIFGETFYTGSYTETEGLASDVIMSLTQGFDDTVTFSLAGAQSQWFTVEQTGNMATLVVTQPIDSAVIANNHYIMFTINAVKPGTMGASSAVSITLPDDFSSATVLRFEQASYTGTLLENDLQLSEIILVEGYQDNVVFDLLGEFQEHFVHSNVGNVVRIAIQNMLPTDFTEPFTTLELVASGPESISTHATIVLQVGRDDIIEQPIFGETFYTGSYTETEGLASDVIMSLTQGFDDTVTFFLAGAQSQWFTVEQTGNMATLVVTQPIDSAVIANNHYIMFTINAVKPGTMGASSAVSITLPDDFSSATVLRFEQASYTGTLLENDLQLSEIILVEGYQDNVVFDLLGEFQEHFVHSNVGNVVRIAIQNMLPTDFTELFTTLELVASGPESISTHATIVLQVGRDDIIEQPIFGETFYTGSYTETEGLASDVIMSLTQGFDETVTFSLAGAQSQWFTVEQTGNMATLVVTQPIDSAVIANNHYIMFTINAVKPGTMGASSAVSISLPDDLSSATVLRFEQASYTGTLLENDLQLSEIILVEGYQDNVVFDLLGEFQEHFVHSNVGNVVRIAIQNMLPTDFTEPFTTLELVASGSESISTHATIVLQVGRDDIIEQPIFGETFYTGSYTETEGLASDVIMSLTQGFDETVTFSLAGAQSQWFTVEQTGNMATLVVTQPIDSAVIANNHYIMFTINAVKPGTMGASSAVSISLPDDLSSATVLRFEQASYTGTLLENDLQLSEIILVEGYQDNVVFDLLGEFQEHFVHSNVGNVVRIAIQNMLPTDFTELFTTLELVASGPESISTHATIVLQVGRDDIIEQPIFGETFYTGSYTETEGLASDVIMSLTQGFDETVTFSLAGAQSQWFTVEQTGNMATLVVTQPIDSAVIANNHYIMFTINAVKPGTMGASSAVSISLPDDFSSAIVLRFEQASYTGTLLENDLQLSEIILVEGYQDNVVFDLLGEFQEHFVHSNVGNVVRIAIQNMLPTDFTEPFTTLELVASGPESISTHATIVLQVGRDDIIEQPIFGETFYIGSYTETEGLASDVTMSLTQGFDETVTFSLAGAQSQWFTVEQTGNMATLVVTQPIDSAVIANNHYIMFSINAFKPGTMGASSAVSISLPDGGESGAFFERALYRGRTEQGVTGHELILLYGFTGTTVQISGEHASQFEATLSGGGGDGSGGFVVTVQSTGGAPIPPDVAHAALQLEAGLARTALVIDVIHTESSVPPSVVFELDSYVIRVDSSQSGLLGRVSATAENGETLVYSLNLENGHYLADRLSVSSGGELWLSAPANSGFYQFGVWATTVASHVTAETTVHLTVDSVMVCGSDDRFVDPLIILERDEEEPHDDLILLNADLTSECSYSFSYRWPQDRDWLYINERGHLSARAIDREDPAIAFMAQSQVQIELVLTCSDTASRSRHTREVLDRNQTNRNVGPYEYGTSRWILTDGINYNSRRSFVNLIVNDINDNSPIFVAKDNEPIVVGYPVPYLLDMVSPTTLISLQASDADIGENAELVYWSEASALAVSARSGAVHVRDNAARALADGSTFTVHATDRAGAPTGSLTGDIDIMVRLLELQHIAVLTIRDALLEDEGSIIDQLSNSLPYEVKSLRATVISDEYDVEDELVNARALSREQNKTFYDPTVIKENTESENIIKRSRRQAEASAGGASLRIYIYGLEFTEPIEAYQLISDIENSAISETWVASYEMSNLRDHLESINMIIYEDSSKGLLVSTIVLSCLLFLIIVFIIVWYFVVIRKRANYYKQFSDTTSQSSNRTIDPPSKIEEIVRPRPNIEEIKRTEQRLQEMLQQPVLNPNDGPDLITIDTSPKSSVKFDTISEVPQLRNTSNDQSVIDQIDQVDELPIVIQSIDKLKTSDDTDDEDEFGEIKKAKRKSVVTFNEQVEKIIHLENMGDDAEEDSRNARNQDEVTDDVEVYRL